MSRRYSRILQGAQLNTALTAYIAHLQQPRTRNVGTRGARPDSKFVYVTPFGLDLPTGQVARVNNATEGYTALAGRVNAAGTGGEVVDTLGSLNVATIGRFNPARVVWFRNATRATTVVRSDVTNLQYLKYAGDRSSCAFGRKTATDNEYDVFGQIKSGIRTATPTLEINRITLTREKFNYN
jgi:hypothetical protein